MPNYSHFLAMTDTVGMLQFSNFSIPDPRSGYTLDDNARALLIALHMGEAGHEYAHIFLNFLARAQRPDGSWSNFLLDGQYHCNHDSEDSIGRAILACSAAAQSYWPDIAEQADRLLKNNLNRTSYFTSPRAIAYVLIGLCKGKTPYSEKILHELINKLTNYLIGLYNKTRNHDWMWFENSITYCNAIIPQALFSVYGFNGDKKALKIAHESLNFLNEILFNKGYLNIVGNQGWYQRGKSVPAYDQQPVDAASIAFACWEAYHNLGKSEYLNLSNLAHQWYRGKNINALSLYNEANGGCYDALTRKGVNKNQGAEAVLSLLLTDLLIAGHINQEIQQFKSSS
ncbi:MAG: hypothetical protein PHF24_08415 [Syntrophomonas sp.]|nr:hypothetical protein [Syntrophomonas sp.]